MCVIVAKLAKKAKRKSAVIFFIICNKQPKNYSWSRNFALLIFWQFSFAWENNFPRLFWWKCNCFKSKVRKPVFMRQKFWILLFFSWHFLACWLRLVKLSMYPTQNVFQKIHSIYRSRSVFCIMVQRLVWKNISDSNIQKY